MDCDVYLWRGICGQRQEVGLRQRGLGLVLSQLHGGGPERELGWTQEAVSSLVLLRKSH